MKLMTPKTLSVIACASVALPIDLATTDSVEADVGTALTCGSGLFGEDFVRTELFFGLSRPGGRISERQFDRFVDGEVTPRFPDGLTLLSGLGQFRLDDGQIIEEKSKVLVLLHGGDDVASKEIEEIRAEYIEQFDQQSVRRTDEPSCVSF